MSCNEYSVGDMMLRDIRAHREKVLRYVEENYRIAEMSVGDLLKNQSAPNFMKRLDETNTVLQQCCSKLANLSDCTTLENVETAGESFTDVSGKFCVPLQEICFGKQSPVELLSHGTPHRFWIQLAGVSKSRLEQDLKEHYKNKKPLTDEPALGTFVICLTSKLYYRGKVVSKSELNEYGPSKFQVVLIDYGDIITTPLYQMYAMKESFCAQPAMGMLCRIHGLYPVTDYWGLEAVSFFLSSCQNLDATFHKIPHSNEHGSFSTHEADYSVTLKSKRGGESIDISLLMIAKGYAIGDECILESQNSPVPPMLPSSNRSLASNVTSPSELNFCDAVSNTSRLNCAAPEFNPVKSKMANFPSPSPALTFSSPSPCEVPPPPPPKKTERDSNVGSGQLIRNAALLMKAERDSNISSGHLIRNTVQRSLRSNPAVSPCFNSASSHRDNVDESSVPAILKAQFHQSPVEDLETQEIDFPCRTGPDPQLMDRFLNSSAEMSVLRQSRPPTNFSALPRDCLEYDFGAVFKSRPLPFLSINRLTFSLGSILSPSHFYVYPCDELPWKLISLTERLNVLYRDSNPIPVSLPEIGSCWVVRDKNDPKWSRVKVTALDLVLRSVRVIFVDYGYHSTVGISELRPPTKELADIPCLAVRSLLGGIYPIGQSDKNSTNWSEEATKKLIEFFGDGLLFEAMVEPAVGKDGELSLIVFDRDGDEEKLTVNELLIGMGLASSNVFLVGNSSASKEEQDFGEEQWGDPMAEDFYRYTNNATLNDENYDSVTKGYIPQDSKRICRFFSATGKCFKGIKCEQLHSIPNKHLFTADQEEYFVDIPEEPSPSPGSMVSVNVTHVISNCSMYIVLPHGTRDLRYACADIEEFETLQTLQNAMQDEYGTNFYQHRYSLYPALGDIVVAKSSHDALWYRGQVMADNAEDNLRIFFLDFGNTEVVHLKDLCRLLPRFSHLPKQAIEVFLNGIHPHGDELYMENGREELVKLVRQKDLVAEIVMLLPYMSINLYDTNGSRDIDIAERLIMNKAIKRGRKYPVTNNRSSTMIAG